MTAYIVRRLLITPLILFGVTLLIFGMLSQLSPAQRVSLYVADVPKRTGELERLIEQHGLNDPIHEQYVRWIRNAARGDLGYSNTGKEPVATLIWRRLPATIELALFAAIPILIIGVRLGVVAATNHNRAIDHVLRIGSIVGTSTPSFILGLLLLMFFAADLGWFPTGERLIPAHQQVVDSGLGWTPYTRMYTVDALLNGRLEIFVDALRHLVLPVITLAYISWAILVRVTRASMLETLRQDYVRTARAKGLSERSVTLTHARPNALLPVVTIGGGILISLMNGVAITETIFNYPGLGKRFIDAATNLDVVTVLGFTLVNGLFLIVGNLVVDLLYAYLDPRVRLA